MTDRARIHQATHRVLERIAAALPQGRDGSDDSVVVFVRTSVLHAAAAALTGPAAAARLRNALGGPRELEAWAGTVDLSFEGTLARPDERRALAVAVELGAVYEALLAHQLERSSGRWRVTPGPARRTAGAHHTEPDIAADIVERALAPLRARGQALKVCDPALGTGVFLVLVAEKIQTWTGAPMSEVVRSLFGVDRDPVAVTLARTALAELTDCAPAAAQALSTQIVCADFTLRRDAPAAGVHGVPFDLARTFPEVAAQGGFDAIVGNPPWVAFAGRATQPIDPAYSSYLKRTARSFAKFVTLHGVFVERAAELLRPGGRLGLLVPTSMADLAGYAPARQAHDVYASPDAALPEYGADAFAGVFQPAMAVLSTRRAHTIEPGANEWSLADSFAGEVGRTFVDRLAKGAPFPPETFGERGFQTSARDRPLLSPAPSGKRTLPLRRGADVAPFARLPPSYFVDPQEIGPRLRPAGEYERVEILIRQTARFPMAARSDGVGFRNSVLAAFGSKSVPQGLLLAYLNSTPLRLWHYARFRDARQGMPQIKIGHLRALPAWLGTDQTRMRLTALGERLGAENRGITPEQQDELDQLVLTAMSATPRERELMQEFARGAGRVPVGRPRAAS